eukprot:TRINITY_DN6548_c0_g1_i1.p1 TRINITY_DN6548_c0_g1~~TRINITY_DN6548_c0_g1_i1.p1  ORF type:complete len:108 (-),score=22.11 TRINITY_DN6548_c0_g1_i1:987-1310(-)
MKIAECNEHVEIDSNPLNPSTHQLIERPGCIPLSPQQQSSSDLSSSGTYSSIVSTGEYLEYSEANAADPLLRFPSSPLVYRPHNDESMDFWLNLYMETGEWPELPEL